MYFKQSSLFLANRLIDFVIIMSMVPASQSSIMRLNSSRFLVLVPEIPSSAYMPANSHSGFFWINKITVCYNGSVGETFYQDQPFLASDDVNVLYPKFDMTKEIRLQAKLKPNNYMESCVINEADEWRGRNVWYPGRSVRYAPKGVTTV